MVYPDDISSNSVFSISFNIASLYERLMRATFLLGRTLIDFPRRAVRFPSDVLAVLDDLCFALELAVLQHKTSVVVFGGFDLHR